MAVSPAPNLSPPEPQIPPHRFRGVVRLLVAVVLLAAAFLAGRFTAPDDESRPRDPFADAPGYTDETPPAQSPEPDRDPASPRRLGPGQLAAGDGDLCVQAPAVPKEGDKLEVGPCDRTSRQTWDFTSDKNLRNGGFCMDSPRETGSRVQLYTCNHSSPQAFELTPAGQLIVAETHRCLRIGDAKGSEPRPLVQVDCAQGAPTRWSFL